jgi:hypothetical protein
MLWINKILEENASKTHKKDWGSLFVTVCNFWNDGELWEGIERPDPRKMFDRSRLGKRDNREDIHELVMRGARAAGLHLSNKVGSTQVFLPWIVIHEDVTPGLWGTISRAWRDPRISPASQRVERPRQKTTCLRFCKIEGKVWHFEWTKGLKGQTLRLLSWTEDPFINLFSTGNINFLCLRRRYPRNRRRHFLTGDCEGREDNNGTKTGRHKRVIRNIRRYYNSINMIKL